MILDGIQQSVDDFLGVSCFVLLRERDQAGSSHSFDFCGATIFGQHVQHPPSMDILATKYPFELWVGAHKGGADLIDQPGVGPGKVFVDAVEYFQLTEHVLDAVNIAQGIREVSAGVGDDVGVANISFRVSDMNPRQLSHRQSRKIFNGNPHVLGDRDSKPADVVGLVDHNQNFRGQGEEKIEEPA